MPTDLIRRIDCDLLYPQFLSLYLDTLAACQARGIIYYATFGTRTYDEQNALYAQGRTTMAPSGPLPGMPFGRPVTNAKGGQSAHNLGLATDSTHDSDSNTANGLQPDWKAENYIALRDEGMKRGLVSGSTFKSADWPHLQLAGCVTGTELAPLAAIYESTEGDVKTKLAAVWAHLDTLSAVAVGA